MCRGEGAYSPVADSGFLYPGFLPRFCTPIFSVAGTPDFWCWDTPVFVTPLPVFRYPVFVTSRGTWLVVLSFGVCMCVGMEVCCRVSGCTAYEQGGNCHGHMGFRLVTLVRLHRLQVNPADHAARFCLPSAHTTNSVSLRIGRVPLLCPDVLSVCVWDCLP